LGAVEVEADRVAGELLEEVRGRGEGISSNWRADGWLEGEREVELSL
jgi:hypothetical protein